MQPTLDKCGTVCSFAWLSLPSSLPSRKTPFFSLPSLYLVSSRRSCIPHPSLSVSSPLPEIDSSRILIIVVLVVAKEKKRERDASVNRSLLHSQALRCPLAGRQTQRVRLRALPTRERDARRLLNESTWFARRFHFSPPGFSFAFSPSPFLAVSLLSPSPRKLRLGRYTDFKHSYRFFRAPGQPGALLALPEGKSNSPPRASSSSPPLRVGNRPLR